MAPQMRRNSSPLRSERIQHHWTQRELAERIGANVASVKRWERQVNVPGPYFRIRLTALFGKSEEALGLRARPSLAPFPPVEEAMRAGTVEPACASTSSCWLVPYLRNPYFTGREKFLAALDERLTGIRQGETLATRCVALTGLGGIGKTQLAVEYAYRMREQGTYTHIFWINAASEEALMTGFIAVANLLPEIAGKEEIGQQKLVDAVKGWLEDCPQRWLLIFDNADDLSLLQPSLPRYGNGCILLTTRVHAIGSLALALSVDMMSIEEGMHLLAYRAQRREPLSAKESVVLRELVLALDACPLALDQAGAYIEETGCTFDTYLHLYRTHRGDMLARRGVQAFNYPDSVATTWSLSFEQVQLAHPAAAQLMRLCAFLAPDHIPEELLRDGAPYWPPLLQQVAADPFAFELMLAALLRVSLIKRLANDHMVSLHRLVQIVQVEMLSEQQQQQWARCVVRAVNALFPRQLQDDSACWPRCARYIEQVQTCATLIQRYQLQCIEAADLLERAGIYLYLHASYAQAEEFYLHALRLNEQIVGTQHPQTASIFHHLGHLYLRQGRYEQAEASFQQALAIREQLGVQHSETAETLYQLGRLRSEQGRYEQAESYYHQTLAIFERQVGRKHAKTARVLKSLGSLSCSQGRYAQAESYYQQALAIFEEQAEAHRSRIGCTLNNLGLLYHKQGKNEQAEAYYQQALAIFEQILGTQHPSTGQVLSNLAEVYRDRHNYEQAEPLFVQALAVLEGTLDAHHPDLVGTLHGFARLYEAQGFFQRAVPLYQRALTI